VRKKGRYFTRSEKKKGQKEKLREIFVIRRKKTEDTRKKEEGHLRVQKGGVEKRGPPKLAVPREELFRRLSFESQPSRRKKELSKPFTRRENPSTKGDTS